MSAADPSLWDAEAPAFDEAPDHGLLDPEVRAAWRRLLLGVLPAAPADVVDLGCGTGTLALLLAEHEYAAAPSTSRPPWCEGLEPSWPVHPLRCAPW